MSSFSTATSLPQGPDLPLCAIPFTAFSEHTCTCSSIWDKNSNNSPFYFITLCICFFVIYFLKKKTDEPIFLTKNNIVALKQEQFKVTKRLVGLQKLPPDAPGYEVNLPNIVTWAIREMRLHGFASSEVVFSWSSICVMGALSLVSIQWLTKHFHSNSSYMLHVG